jgi:cytochrome o ubiquinol oxidase operon protein cyoD
MGAHLGEDTPDAIHGTWKSYILGFVLSALLTIGTYFIVVKHLFPLPTVIVTIMIFALVQMVVQLLLFLHLGQEGKPKKILWTFLLTLSVLMIVLFGTLWIMYDLNARMMPPMMGG